MNGRSSKVWLGINRVHCSSHKAKGTAPLPAQPLPHPAGTQDVIPIEQEELQMLAQEVGEADVTASDRQGGVVESETFALDPARWPEVLVGPQDVARLEMFLRNVSSAVLGHHKWRYVANDCVNTLAALAHLSLALPSTLRLSPHIIRAAKVQITRLLVYRKLHQGNTLPTSTTSQLQPPVKVRHHGYVRLRHVLSPQLKHRAHVLHLREAEVVAGVDETKDAAINRTHNHIRQTDGSNL